jgi:hypothetical protein
VTGGYEFGGLAGTAARANVARKMARAKGVDIVIELSKKKETTPFPLWRQDNT